MNKTYDPRRVTTSLLHLCVSVDIARFSDAVLERDWLPMFRDNGIDTVAGIREACASMRAKGFDVFPNADCKNRNAGGGCAGCPVEPVDQVAASEEML
ncbi:MAG TPA: hypothetical protein VHM19_18640 [Polyangiales bacterium]|jgi:hypothetical protein|nr:hypothetical protein [Polyangiales bacterium]